MGRRFLLGFVVGAAISATAVIVLAPKDESKPQNKIMQHINAAIAAGRLAAAAREQELWADLHERLKQQEQVSRQNEPSLPPSIEY